MIDNTLGNVLGIVGQGGAIGVGNLLNAVSLVLNRFVNRDNPISGRLDIAGGVLTDKGLAVQGDRATANVSTRTNLVELDHRHHDQLHDRRGSVGALHHRDGARAAVVAVAERDARHGQGSAGHGRARSRPSATSCPGRAAVRSRPRPLPNIPLPNIPGLFGR